MLAVSINAEFNMAHNIKLQLQAKVNLKIQTYPMHLDRPIHFNTSV